MVTIRVIGIDLAITAAHKAIILDLSSNQFISDVISFHTNPAEIDHLLEMARRKATEKVQLIAVLEATGMAWFTVGSYLMRQGVEVYRVNGRQTADQRRIYHRHAKSDRIDARILPRLYVTAPERLSRLVLPSSAHMELQRGCREVMQLNEQIVAIKNRLSAADDFAWLSWKGVVAPYDLPARWLREHWYNPWRVQAAGVGQLTLAWKALHPDDKELDWIPSLVEKAKQVTAFYPDPQQIDYDRLQTSLARWQTRLEDAETQQDLVRKKVVRPLYRQLHPERHLESLYGVGQDSAAVYIAFVYDILRFPSANDFRGWSGLIPFSDQSGEGEVKGLHIAQAGPDLIKATAFLNAGVARLWDPQMAALYYDQMMFKGKHHNQAICACATHLLTHIFVILKENRPFELRDVDGSPITKRQARLICRERYTVPEEVRQKNNVRARRRRAEQRLEKRTHQREQ